MAGRTPRERRRGRRLPILAAGTAMLGAILVFLALVSTTANRCDTPLGLRPARTAALACESASNGVEYASYVCAVPPAEGADYTRVSADVVGPEGVMLGHWDAPIRYGVNGRAAPVDAWGPLDTSAHLADDGDGVFGPGDVFHLDAVQMYRFGGSSFTLRGECWSGSAVLA